MQDNPQPFDGNFIHEFFIVLRDTCRGEKLSSFFYEYMTGNIHPSTPSKHELIQIINEASDEKLGDCLLEMNRLIDTNGVLEMIGLPAGQLGGQLSDSFCQCIKSSFRLELKRRQSRMSLSLLRAQEVYSSIASALRDANIYDSNYITNYCSQESEKDVLENEYNNAIRKFPEKPIPDDLADRLQRLLIKIYNDSLQLAEKGFIQEWNLLARPQFVLFFCCFGSSNNYNVNFLTYLGAVPANEKIQVLRRERGASVATRGKQDSP